MGRWWVLALAGVGCGRIAFDPLAVNGDAGDAGDGNTTANTNIAFITSTDVSPSTLGGQAGADAICAQRALAAGLPPNTYVAWLSTSTVDAKARLASARGWLRTDGLPFADSVDALTTGRLFYPLRLDENQNDRPDVPTPTGTTRTGVFDSRLSQCADFTGTGMATFGWSDGGTEMWTEEPAFDCNDSGPLYCFGIDHQRQVTVPPVSGRRAFVTYTGFGANVGIAGADMICANEATSAGLPGTFIALLADVGTTAASRFSVADGPWYRVDGVEVTSDLVTARAALDLHADGVPVTGVAWTGATSATTPGEMASTCNGWLDAGASGRVGTVGRSNDAWFSSGPLSCSLGPGVYCFQL
jgi:hypothetical protein